MSQTLLIIALWGLAGLPVGICQAIANHYLPEYFDRPSPIIRALLWPFGYAAWVINQIEGWRFRRALHRRRGS